MRRNQGSPTPSVSLQIGDHVEYPLCELEQRENEKRPLQSRFGALSGRAIGAHFCELRKVDFLRAETVGSVLCWPKDASIGEQAVSLAVACLISCEINYRLVPVCIIPSTRCIPLVCPKGVALRPLLRESERDRQRQPLLCGSHRQVLGRLQCIFAPSIACISIPECVVCTGCTPRQAVDICVIPGTWLLVLVISAVIS